MKPYEPTWEPCAHVDCYNFADWDRGLWGDWAFCAPHEQEMYADLEECNRRQFGEESN